MSKRSKVHPTYKTRYRVANWPEYDRALVRRGDLTIWFTPSAIRSWTPLPTGQRGGQRKYSEPCVELALTLKLLFGLPWRSVEGLLGSLLHCVGLEAPIQDHTTLSRRTRGLDVQLRRPPSREPIHLVVDATGLGIIGQGQWASAKWGEPGSARLAKAACRRRPEWAHSGRRTHRCFGRGCESVSRALRTGAESGGAPHCGWWVRPA